MALNVAKSVGAARGVVLRNMAEEKDGTNDFPGQRCTDSSPCPACSPPFKQAAVASTKTACSEAEKNAMEESDKRWRAVLREHLDKAADKAAEAAVAASRENDVILEETQQAFRL